MIVQVALKTEYKEINGELKQVIKRGMAKVVVDYSADELGTAIDEMIKPDAVIITDMWTSYPNAVKDREHISFLSEKGENLNKLHWHIFNLKNWIRGIHHKVSPEHLQQYLNEFYYRFNRRNQIHAKASHDQNDKREMASLLTSYCKLIR